jgi:hypothetical protein
LNRQDINLLTGSPGRSSPQPTARRLAAALLVLIVCGIASSLWQSWRASSFERAVITLNADIDGVIMDLEERSQFLAERDADPALVAELKRREREVEDKTRVLDLLSGESVGNTDGFSAHLEALGRRHPYGLWLDTIRIADGGRELMLAGRTLQARLVPEFLNDLQREPALAGTAFASFTMAGDDSAGEPMRFALATACAPSGAGDESQSAETCLSPVNNVDASLAAAEPLQ